MLRGLLILVVASALGCDDLHKFRIGPDEMFSGPVVGSDSPEAGVVTSGCDFVLCGFPERTSLSLSDFDPELAGSAKTRGVITTSDDMFVDAQLVQIPGLEHDALSQYTFPGGGRVRNYMLGARFGTNGNRYAMVFVSLMEDGRIEVRVHAPSTQAGGDDALFGVFRLCRGGCGS